MLFEKLLAIQEKVSAIKKKEKNPFFNSKYADINAILAEIKPLLTKHGLVILQPLSYIAEGGTVIPAIETVINCPETKEQHSWKTPLPQIVDAQKHGGAITYFRRYCIVSFFCLEAEDDDGNTASGKTGTSQRITPVQRTASFPVGGASQVSIKPNPNYNVK